MAGSEHTPDNPGVETRLASIETAIGDVLAAVAGLRTAVMDRIDRLQNSVTAMGDDVGVNFGRADRAVDAATANARQIEGLSREISGMSRQIQRLQTDMRTLKGEG